MQKTITGEKQICFDSSLLGTQKNHLYKIVYQTKALGYYIKFRVLHGKLCSGTTNMLTVKRTIVKKGC